MTILPKKKITSKEKVEQQRYANNQRHIPSSVNNQTLSPDMVLPPFNSAASYNYQNYLNSHRTSGGSHDSNHSLYARSLSQNHLNSWININPVTHNEEIANQSSRNFGILSPNANHGGVSKRKKKREGNSSLSNAMLSVKPSSWKPRAAESCISDPNEASEPDELETPHGTAKTGSPSQPHQNSEDEYEIQTEVSTQEQELRFERQLKAKKGFLVKKMREDGACLFRAISDQIYGDQDMHSIIRNLVCDYMVKNRDFFHQFVTEDFNKYIERKRVDSEHGNHVELQAISEMYNRPIEIYIYEAEPSNVFQSSYRTDNPPIRLSYHNNMHYNSVIDPYAASVGIGLGLPSFTPGIADKNQLKDAMRASESQYIEQAMYEDKLRATDWEATSDAISEAVLRESRLQFLRDQEKQLSSLVGGPATTATAASTSPRSSPGYSTNIPTSSGNCGKPCCSYSTASPPSATTFGTASAPGHGRESPGYGGGGVGMACSDISAATTASSGMASCCFTSTCTNSNFTVSISGKDQQQSVVLSGAQRSSPHHHPHSNNYQLRSLSSSPKASSYSPNAAASPGAGGGNKSPLLNSSLNTHNNGMWGMSSSSCGGGGGSLNAGPSSRLSPCPSPDTAAAMSYMWSPNSPKMLYTAAGADMLDAALVSNGGLLASAGVGGGGGGSEGVGGVGSSVQQQQQATEYNLLRALMESQLEYYNSFSRSAAARKSPPSSVSPQPGPSTS